MIRNIITFAAAVLQMVAFAMAPSAAMAQSYNGNWPATVSGTIFSNGAYCLTLSDERGSGGVLQGEASWVSDGIKWEGQFFIIDGTLMVQIFVPEGAGEIGAQVWTAHASQGKIGSGVFGGVGGDDGKVVFGEKNGCSVSQ
ncbi:MAG: hypothetical protein ABSH50_32865 [Bryobacteraceae bacterium]|jgi:hypothetical protein